MILLLTLALSLLTVGQVAPPRDRAAAPAPASGTVRGKITGADTRAGLHRVRVTLNGAAQPAPTGVTNTEGEYEIAQVPAGVYTVAIARSGYLPTSYGQRRRAETGRPIDVKAGATVSGIDVALMRGGVVAGTVTDDLGGDYPGIRVEAVEPRYLRGRRVLVQVAAATTNDLGQYRITNLPPGPYLIRAGAQETWESDDGASAYAYATTFYPGVAGQDAAETVIVAAGREVSPLNFAMRAARAARITGVFQNAAGEPLAAQSISLSLLTRTADGAPMSSSSAGTAVSNQSGGFEFRNLAPGEYSLSSGGDASRATLNLVLRDGDERDVILRPQAPVAVGGQIVFDPEGPPPPAAGRISVVAIAADPETVFRSFNEPAPAPVTRDWSFRFANLNGSQHFRIAGLPEEWALARVSIGDRDVTEQPLAITAAVANVRLDVSHKVGKVTGLVTDARRRPAADSAVVIFSADRSRWSFPSRFVKTVRPDSTGRFTVSGLLPGPYRAAALEFVDNGQSDDPAFLGSLFERATPFEAVALDTVSIDLAMVRPR